MFLVISLCNTRLILCCVFRCISHPLLHISVWRRFARLLSGGGARSVHLWGRNHLLGETLPHLHRWDKPTDRERERERDDETVWLWLYLMTHRAQAHFNKHKSYFIMLPSPCRLVAVPRSSVDQLARPLLRCAWSLIGCWSGLLKHLHSDLLSASDAVARQH